MYRRRKRANAQDKREAQKKKWKPKKVKSMVVDVSNHDHVDGPEQNDERTHVAILGHSFVERIAGNIKRYVDTTKAEFAREFQRLEDERITAIMSGLSGGKIKDLSKIKEDIKDLPLSPTICIIDLGSNDLCNEVNINDLVKTYKQNIEKMCREDENIKMVVICQALYRNLVPAWCVKHIDDYNNEVDKLNHQLMKMTRNHYERMHWHHKGLIQPPEPFTDDGVHPDTESGKLKYFRSLVTASIEAKRELYYRQTMTKTQWRKCKKESRLVISRAKHENFVFKQYNKGETSAIYHFHEKTCVKNCEIKLTNWEISRIVARRLNRDSDKR